MENTNFELKIDSNWIIYGYEGNCPENLVIPEKVNWIIVKSIWDNAFFQKNLKSVDLSKTQITSVWIWVFADNQIENVFLPNTLTSVWDYAFYFNDLTDLDLSNTQISSIWDSAFTNNKITNIVFPDTLKSIWTLSFSHNKLISVSFPKNLKSIWNYAFNFNYLTNITFLNNLDSKWTQVFIYNWPNIDSWDITSKISKEWWIWTLVWKKWVKQK